VLSQWLDQDKTTKSFLKLELHQKKKMLTVWWYQARLIHYELLNIPETINAVRYYLQIKEMNQKCSAFTSGIDQ